MATYFTLLTHIGQAKIANAVALGQNVAWTHMAVGDGNGNPTTPSESQTALVRERYRAPINQLTTDPDNPNYMVAELVVPTNVGGWSVHEVGIFDEDDDLVAVANFPATYKPQLEEGSGRDLAIRIIVQVSNASGVQLKIDPAIVLASRAWVETNFLRRSKVAGGTTGQVLRKRTNAAEDFEWGDPGEVNITINTVEELQTLTAEQVLVDLAIVPANGAAFYIEGVRLTADDYEIVSPSTIELANPYPTGTKLLAVRNEPAAHPTNYTRQTANFQAGPGDRYFIDGDHTATLPPTGALAAGAAVKFIKAHGAEPIIEVDGTNGEQIKTAAGADTAVIFDINSEIVLVWTGTQWEV